MSALTAAALRQFTGSLERIRHPINRRVLYSPGIAFLAEEGGAYWLIDEIALALGSTGLRRAIAADPRVGDFHVWTLTVASRGAALLSAAADSGERPFLTQIIPFTDFPLERIGIWAGFDGEHWTLYLPSEH